MEMRKISKLCGIYKGEGRILILPSIPHVAGFSVQSDKGQVINEFDDYEGIGEALWNAEKIIEESPMAKTTANEQEKIPTWEKYSKYKTYRSFWNNNYRANYIVYEDGGYEIYSTKKIDRGGYGGCIKEIILPPQATAEELGKAVMEVFEAAEEYYKENKF